MIKATEHIEDPIRTLEARAELELLGQSDRVSDELLRTIIPDALVELSPGSSAFQRALTEQAHITTTAADANLVDIIEPEEIDAQRTSQALKLYTQARALRQTGQGTEAIKLLAQASRLDPNSPSIQREIGNALIISNDRVGAMRAFERAVELGDRSPRGLIHLASQASSQGDDERVIWLTTQALDNNSIVNHPMARSIAGVLLGTSEIKSGYLKAGCQTLAGALDSFDTTSRDLRWKREIIEIMSQRSQLRILVGDAWASMGAHERAQESYAKAGDGIEQLPMALVARQIVSALRQGHPARASLIFLDHLQHNATDLSTEEHTWAKSLSTIEGIGDMLGSAIGELGNRPGLPGSIRQMLMGVELDALDTPAAVRALAAGDLDADDPLVCMQVFHRISDEDERFDAAVAIMETNPSIARSIALGLGRTLRDPVAFMYEHANPDSDAGELLIASMGIGLGRTDLIEHLDSVSADTLEDRSTQWLAVHAQALALAGQWEHASAIVDRLTAQNDADATGMLASTLIANQHPKSAWKIIELQANDADADVEDLMLGAQIAQTLNRYESAAAFLERASELDPYNERIYEQLFLLRSSASPIGNEEDLRFVVRQLSSTRPRSSLLGLIRANELARNGLINEAEALLVSLNTKHPYQEIGYDLLLSIWKTWSTQDRPDALIDGIEWLEARLVANPNSIETMLKAAQGYIELEQLDHSLELLEDGYARTGSYELARALELLLAGPLEQPEAANKHIANRLGARLNDQQGINPAIEYAGFLAKQATPETSAQLQALLIDNLPRDSKLLPAQHARLSQVIFTMAGSIETLNHETDILSVISLIEKHSQELGFQLSRIKVLLLASLPQLDMDGLIIAVNLAVEQSTTDEQRDMLRTLPIQSLLGENRPHEAIALAARFATLNNTLDTDFAIETYRLLAGVGTNADMIGMLDLFEERGVLEETIALTTEELGTPDRGKPATSIDEKRADLAYTAAALTTAFQRPEQSASYYELSLSYDPDHAWSNNDYGYMLAEEGVRMDYAVELLERAAAVLPNEASVIDSLAWVRYKMGIFDDIPQTTGQPTKGAISLLMRANELDIKRENATIMLHLGDALWRGGYKDRASNAWIGAEDIARSRIRLLNAQPNPNRNAIEAMSIELREIRYRIQDADSTGNPKIAPLATDTEPITETEP